MPITGKVVSRNSVAPPAEALPHEQPDGNGITPQQVVSEDELNAAQAAPLTVIEEDIVEADSIRNIIDDVTKDIPNPSKPQPPKPQPVITTAKPGDIELKKIEDIEDFMDASIVARPMYLPDVLVNIKKSIIRHEYAYRAIYKGGDGSNIARWRAAGFVNATDKDVNVNTLGPETNVQDGGNTIVFGDIILMKIPKERYFGALKYNDMRAKMLMSREGLMKGAKSAAEKQLAADLGGRLPADKVEFFVPSAKEAVAKAGEEK